MDFSFKRVSVILHDLVMVVVAFGLAYAGRFNFTLDENQLGFLMGVAPSVVVAQGLILWWSHLYRGVWHFASIPDLWNIFRAALVGALAVTLALFLHNRLEGIPRSTLMLYPIFLIVLLGGPRLTVRFWKDHKLKFFATTERKRVLILGAGRAGEMLARDMVRDEEYRPVGFLDDNVSLKGAKVHGVSVLGTIDELNEFVAKLAIDVIIIAMPSATNSQMQKMVSLCEKAGAAFRTLPRLQDMMNGRDAIHSLREVSIDDLLGRDSVTLDWHLISQGLHQKVVLVSGGGGSIGSELSRQIARMGPKHLIIFDHSEYNLYQIELELRDKFPALKSHARLGSIDDIVAVERLMADWKPQVIFHAAAYKHVPMLEAQSREAVQNNILGTQIMALAAHDAGVEKFVLISTDKAVNPANIMGATKRVAEIYCQNLNARSKTDFVTVRFGNVLDSAGSVVPLFKDQIRKGGPVTVTHPEITRYFMTIPEASQLIMQAGVMGQGGEIFVLDMGDPIKISYLAEQMIRLSGKEPGKDIDIVFTGLRPGEKLYEELFHEQESLGKTSHQKIFLSHSRRMDWKKLEGKMKEFEAAVDGFDEARLKSLIIDLVPEYCEHCVPKDEKRGVVIPLAAAASVE